MIPCDRVRLQVRPPMCISEDGVSIAGLISDSTQLQYHVHPRIHAAFKPTNLP
jgi:hypothetical protein